MYMNRCLVSHNLLINMYIKLTVHQILRNLVFSLKLQNKKDSRYINFINMCPLLLYIRKHAIINKFKCIYVNCILYLYNWCE